MQGAIAAGADSTGKAVNAFGVDLYQRAAATEGNVCLSPYSISTVLAMTLAGAAGETRIDMAHVLHVGGMEDVDASFTALGKSLAASVAKTEQIARDAKKIGGPGEPITLTVANRLFPQSGYAIRPAFLKQVQKFYGAPPEPLDFAKDGASATRRINRWVEKGTRDRIRDLIPVPLGRSTRLVLANALYFKAPWVDEFSVTATKPVPFHVRGGSAVEVPTMRKVTALGYRKRDGYCAVSLPYAGGEVQFVILLPDEGTALARLEKMLSSKMLAECAQLSERELDLWLRKFKFEPPTIALAEELKALG